MIIEDSFNFIVFMKTRINKRESNINEIQKSFHAVINNSFKKAEILHTLHSSFN